MGAAREGGLQGGKGEGLEAGPERGQRRGRVRGRGLELDPPPRACLRGRAERAILGG